jgi:hypothetical protein
MTQKGPDFIVLWIRTPCSLEHGTNIMEEHGAFNFRVEENSMFL